MKKNTELKSDSMCPCRFCYNVESKIIPPDLGLDRNSFR